MGDAEVMVPQKSTMHTKEPIQKKGEPKTGTFPIPASVSVSPEPPVPQPPSPAADLEAASDNVDNEEEDLDKTPDVSREVQQINTNTGLPIGYAPSGSTGASFPPVGMQVPEVPTGADATSVDEAKVIDDFMRALEKQDKEEARFMQTSGGNHLLPSLAAEHLPVETLAKAFLKPFTLTLLPAALTATGMAHALIPFGVKPKNAIACLQKPTFIAQRMCVNSAMASVKYFVALGTKVAALNGQVLAGGRTAQQAMARLRTLWSRPFAKELMKSLGTTMVCKNLMSREITPGRARWQAGSLITLLTDMPVVSSISDVATGGYGHLNVVVSRPSRVHRADKAIAALNAGADPADLIDARDDI
ncbi:unnamed protein product [Vitrella brassicaformis CCMP3155]|uniref:Uncharacterized protein n=1 Tax=Vitrella brassicaformis (strain CCMP3155) TaxID=1169540 RepID=A0A0G4EKX6_VITBC|nr:unnamed protein product [Vitrella brassicaformis CCMP3155]|eukprot:CEL98045.1 unnamed protein product [Vitrella brassicaformis CCMP3155]